MASIIELTFIEMRNKANELEKWNNQLKNNKVPELRGHQQRLTASWDGVANDEFDKAFQSDMVQYQNFCRLIEDYIRALRAAADEYERMEVRNKDIANRRNYK